MESLLRHWGAEIDSYVFEDEHDEQSHDAHHLNAEPPLIPFPIMGTLLYNAAAERPDQRRGIFGVLAAAPPSLGVGLGGAGPTPPHSGRVPEPAISLPRRPQSAQGVSQPTAAAHATRSNIPPMRPLSSSCRSSSTSSLNRAATSSRPLSRIASSRSFRRPSSAAATNATARPAVGDGAPDALMEALRRFVAEVSAAAATGTATTTCVDGPSEANLALLKIPPVAAATASLRASRVRSGGGPAAPIFAPEHLVSKRSCFEFPLHRKHASDWSASCASWEKWLARHQALSVEERARSERDQATAQAEIELRRRARIEQLHTEIDQWAKEERQAARTQEAAFAVDDLNGKAIAPPGVSLASGDVANKGIGLSVECDDMDEPKTRPHTPVKGSSGANTHQEEGPHYAEMSLPAEAVSVSTPLPSSTVVTPHSLAALDIATRIELRGYVSSIGNVCASLAVAAPTAATSESGAVACFDQAAQRFQQDDPVGALNLLMSFLPSSTILLGGDVTDLTSPTKPLAVSGTKSSRPSTAAPTGGAFVRRRLSDSLRGAMPASTTTTRGPSSRLGGGSKSSRTTTPPPPPQSQQGSTVTNRAPRPPSSPADPVAPSRQVQFGSSEYYVALLKQMTTHSNSTHHTAVIGLPVSLLANISLCFFANKDFHGAMRVVGPMLAMGCDPACMSPLALVIALRSSILLMDLRSAKMALSKLARYKAFFLTELGGTNNSDEVLSGYTLCVDHLEKYRDCINRSAFADALAHITSACNVAFHHVALEAMRLDTMCYARPAVEVHDDLIQLLEVYPSEQALWMLKAHLAFLFSTSSTAGGGSGTSSTSLCYWNALRGAQQATLRALALRRGECPRAASYLRMLRTVTQRIQAAEDLVAQKKWDGAFVAYREVVTGCCVLATSSDATAAIPSNSSAESAELLNSSHTTLSSRGCDVDVLTLVTGGAGVAPFNQAPELTPTELQRIVQQSIFILTTVKIEMLNCQLKAGNVQSVVEACTTLLSTAATSAAAERKPPKNVRPGTASSTKGPKNQPTQHSPVAPSTATIPSTILKSLRAQAYLHSGKYKEALADAKDVYNSAPSQESKEFMEFVDSYVHPHRQQDHSGAGAGNPSGGGERGPKRSAKQSSRPPPIPTPSPIFDHYRVLGLQASASTADIAKAYKVAALKWHPDKWASGSDAEKALAEERFKEANNAYSVLSGDE